MNAPASPPRLVGIDLGTTNSAVAWLDASSPLAPPALVQIPQLVAAGEVSARPTLPSFLYFPTVEERATGSFALPWDPNPETIVGVLARDHGALVPTRQISSAKSWLSHAAVDRRMPLLPWSAESSPKLSAVEASARILVHIRDAWNYTYARADEALQLQKQTIVLTVPASFDDEARELTVEAARQAGFEQVTLLEEPLAALYAWLIARRAKRRRTITGGQQVLVCDVGGGTTDFSLIRSQLTGATRFERVAIGEHLLLGGDNVDLALAALVDRRLADAGGAQRIAIKERQMLSRQCSVAKERLLTDQGPERATITVLGAGRSLVGASMTTELTRDDVVGVLDQFLPIVSRDERPQRGVRHGLREIGLPYETETAVTRHLAAFLARAARLADDADREGSGSTVGEMARPDAVLFNGGFFTPSLARERVLETLTSWFGRRPAVLDNAAPEAAVAIGAASYAGLRQDPASARWLIRAESARSYYVGVQSDGQPGVTTAVCVLPRGAHEGTQATLDRQFTVITNQPAAFTLFSSIDRRDPLDALVTFTEGDLHRHAPLVTAFRYGQRSRRVPLGVTVRASFTEIGTLEIWCESRTTDHRWRLQFNLRGDDSGAGGTAAEEADAAEDDQVLVADEAVADAERLIRGTFGGAGGTPGPDALVGDLEGVLGHGKHAWPLPVIRRLADALLAVADGRRLTPRHEARWLNLTGLCLRPGFGTPVDPWRVSEARKVYVAGLAHPKDLQCQVEWLILWHRVSGGFNTSQQQELATRISSPLGLGGRKPSWVNPQMIREAWRLLASLERLDAAQRTRFGDELVAKVRREPRNAAFLWAIGRLGARAPLYGPLNAVVAPDAAERWLGVLLDLKSLGEDALAAAAQIAARTGDPAREIRDELRERVALRLRAAGSREDALERLQQPTRDLLAGSRLFGERLPEGLRIGSDRSG